MSPTSGISLPRYNFIQTKLTSTKVESAPQADPLTLIRRATFDLIGVAVQAFCGGR